MVESGVWGAAQALRRLFVIPEHEIRNQKGLDIHYHKLKFKRLTLVEICAYCSIILLTQTFVRSNWQVNSKCLTVVRMLCKINSNGKFSLLYSRGGGYNPSVVAVRIHFYSVKYLILTTPDMCMHLITHNQ